MDLIASRARDQLKTLVLCENPFPDETERKELIERSISIVVRQVLHDHSESLFLSWYHLNQCLVFRQGRNLDRGKIELVAFITIYAHQ